MDTARAAALIERLLTLGLVVQSVATASGYVVRVDRDGKTVWSPGAPGETAEAAEYELRPGEVALLKDGDWQVNATRVRVWAVAGDQRWEQFKDKDLVLVPETDKDGARGYASPDVQTLNVSFR